MLRVADGGETPATPADRLQPHLSLKPLARLQVAGVARGQPPQGSRKCAMTRKSGMTRRVQNYAKIAQPPQKSRRAHMSSPILRRQCICTVARPSYGAAAVTGTVPGERTYMSDDDTIPAPALTDGDVDTILELLLDTDWQLDLAARLIEAAQ